jgi:hypothetical protein
VTYHDAIGLYANLNQVEFFAWLEIMVLCVVRLVHLPSLLRKGIVTIDVKIADRRAVLACMILLGAGSVAGRFIPTFFGVTGWTALPFALSAAAAALRAVAVYLYIRTITHERDGELLWGALLAAAIVFALLRRDP